MRARGVEVLLLTDPVDEFWIPAVGKFQDKPFKSVTRGGADLAQDRGKADGEAEKAGGRRRASTRWSRCSG